MQPRELNRLRACSQAIHDAITQTDFSDTGLSLDGFPSECCHYGCSLVGIYLFRKGFTEIRKFSGTRSDQESGVHLWLEVQGVVVDVTAYQFPDVPNSIIVEEVSAWHIARDGKPVAFGSDGERLEHYFNKMRVGFNERFDSLYDRLEVTADGLLTE